MTDRKPASWIIKRRDTGEIVMETFSAEIADAVDPSRFIVTPILQHLVSLNWRTA